MSVTDLVIEFWNKCRHLLSAHLKVPKWNKHLGALIKRKYGWSPFRHSRFSAKCVCVYATDIWMVQLPKGLEGLNNQWLSLKSKVLQKNNRTHVNWTWSTWHNPLNVEEDVTPNHLVSKKFYNSIISWGIEKRFPVNNLDYFQMKTILLFSFCAFVNHSFWNLVRVNRQLLRILKKLFSFSG